MSYRMMILVAFARLAIATPTITDVTAQQRYPWNGKVDVSYVVSGGIDTMAKQKALIASLKLMATDRKTGQTYTASSLSGDTALTDGTHSFTWDMGAQGLTFVSSNVVFRVSCETTPATYCIVDLSAGVNASSYPVTYLAEPPNGGFNVDVYKTTKLVLRRIEPGTFMMCGQYRTTLTKPYYIGVFEVTQKQYLLVMGNNPSSNTGDKRPVENVSYNTLRGNSSGALWPSSSAVDADSFIGKLRSRTGLDFDLPTEAQWEYACRAGTTSKYNNGGDEESDLKVVGRYSANGGDGKGGYSSRSTTVGSYQSNAFGLYDMHGNVAERCLDWAGGLSSPQTDPKGASSGTGRESRGGGWNHVADYCTSSHRNSHSPSYQNVGDGFRLARTLNR